jgi:glyoxylase-like metal-dependent hydrolase (beta-lactamase superfamily II)
MNMAEIKSFPRLIEDDVYFCAFNSPKSYGGNSYFVQHPLGNWLVDSPRFMPSLVEKFQALGGLRYIFLTHRDDVADADTYAERFGAERLIHEADRDAAPAAEIIVRGRESLTPVPGFTIIPVPGHTRGHCVLLYNDKFLFTGDHLEWDASLPGLGAYRDFCWYDWKEQIKSMERLKDYRFEWVLPGHGRRQKLPAGHMQTELSRLIEQMKQPL